MVERRKSSSPHKTPTVVMQALDQLTPQQRNVLFYWALTLISVPSVALIVMVVTPFNVTWPIVVLFLLPVFTGVFMLSPPMAYKLVDMVLRRLAALVPKVDKLIRRDRRDADPE